MGETIANYLPGELKKRYTLWKMKFLSYSHVCKFDAVLEKGVNLPKKEKDVSNLSVIQTMLLIRQKMK